MSLKEITKRRLLEEVIHAVQPSTGWKVLIIDFDSMRVINSACRMYDIMEEGVTLVEKIDIPRQPLPKMDAIYLLTPQADSVDKLIEDFNDAKNPMYAAAHIFFTARLEDKEFQKIKKEPFLCAKIKCLKEINLDFLAHESQVFHFDAPQYFKAIYSPESSEHGTSLQKMADKIVSVCATLKEYPVVRYAKSNQVSNSLASFVQERLDYLMRTSSDYASQANVNPSTRATLLVLDRSIDVAAPLLHEFTYQAMVYDLLDVDTSKDHYKYNAVTTGGENKTKEIVLGETDPLWSTLRHMHIADTMNWILDGFNEFIKENKATKFAKKEKVNDLKEMGEAMKAMPQYQEMLSKYSLHINMANQSMNVFSTKSLSKVAGLEQDMVTGEDAEGKPVKNILSNLAPILTDASVNLQDKLRLLMLYIVSQEGIKDADRKRLIDLASISNDDQACISNLRFLGVTLLRNAKAKKAQNKEKKKKKNRDDAPAFDLSRYTPQIKYILQETVENTLSADDFPYVKEDPLSTDSSANNNSEGKSLRKQTKANWANKEKRKSEKPTQTTNRVLVFIAGGLTHAEMRSAYEVTKKTGREVIIGSSHVLVPKVFVSGLRELKKADQLNNDVV